LSFCLDIARGISYLHGRNVIHGDLKGDNVLVDMNLQCVITDFGMSVVKTASMGTQRKTQAIRWIAPERHSRGYTISKSLDVFAYAMTVYEIWSGWVPFQEEVDDMIVMQWIRDAERPLQGTIPDPIWSFLQPCWHQDPQFRPTFERITTQLQELSVEDVPTPQPKSLPRLDSGVAATLPGAHPVPTPPSDSGVAGSQRNAASFVSQQGPTASQPFFPSERGSSEAMFPTPEGGMTTDFLQSLLPEHLLPHLANLPGMQALQQVPGLEAVVRAAQEKYLLAQEKVTLASEKVQLAQEKMVAAKNVLQGNPDRNLSEEEESGVLEDLALAEQEMAAYERELADMERARAKDARDQAKRARESAKMEREKSRVARGTSRGGRAQAMTSTTSLSTSNTLQETKDASGFLSPFAQFSPISPPAPLAPPAPPAVPAPLSPLGPLPSFLTSSKPSESEEEDSDTKTLTDAPPGTLLWKSAAAGTSPDSQPPKAKNPNFVIDYQKGKLKVQLDGFITEKAAKVTSVLEELGYPDTTTIETKEEKLQLLGNLKGMQLEGTLSPVIGSLRDVTHMSPCLM
jgi:serine/threonine protein kinase